MAFRRRSSLEIKDGALVVRTPYDAGMVAQLKGLPNSDRKYDPDDKVWLVDPKHSVKVAQWIEFFLEEKVTVPEFRGGYDSKLKQWLIIRYVGGSKLRADGTLSSFGILGYTGMDWKVIFPEQVLRDYFDKGSPVVGGLDNYYSLLSISRSANPDEIKTAFRRMAKIWHPDYCKEANASEMFIAVKDAYDVLGDEGKRARYDAGLLLESTIAQTSTSSVADTPWGYRAPLRSGKILVEGINRFSMIEVTKICDWQDITDEQGRTLIVSWPSGAKEPVEEWI